jgi:predicted nucleic acid-binding protein
MTANRRLTLDTNVLVYAADRDAGARHGRAQEIVRQAARVDCILTLQALAEFFRVAVDKRGLPPERAIAVVTGWRDVFAVHAADARALSDAMEAVAAHRLAFWDAMIWATARYAGCRVIVTEGLQDGRELGGVTFLNPFHPTLPPLLQECLDG